MSDAFDPADLLPDELVERIRARADDVDRANALPEQDIDDLARAGYLTSLVPRELGGAALTLERTLETQQRLAGAAPATALGVNMHLVWTAVARVLQNRGDDALAFVLEGAAHGELYAFGISEAGNELVLFDSTTRAEETANGGYAFTGTKIFTSLAPAWTSLGVHGRDDSDPGAPRLVFAFLERDSRVTTLDDWDVTGMRGTQSRTTVLDGAVAPPERVVRVIDPEQGPDLVQFGIFAAFELLISSVYVGIAGRAIELAASAARSRTSARTGDARSEDPVVRDRVGAMAIAYDGVRLELRALARDVDELVDHGRAWFPLLSGMKTRAVDTAQRIVDEAVALTGGAAFRNGNELSRLARDVRAGAFHPSTESSARQSAAAGWLDA